MARLFHLIAALSITLLSNAQGTDTTQYLFGGDIRVSGAGGLILQTGTIGFEDGAMNSMGAGGGILIDRKFLLGIYGTGLTSEIQRPITLSDTSAQLARLDLGHGGFWVQYSFMPHKAIHPFVSMQIGWGSATWNFRPDDHANGEDDVRIPKNINDRILVLAPSAGAEINIAPWFRPTVYVGYRMVDGLALPLMEDGDLDGYFFGINLLFGGFAPQ